MGINAVMGFNSPRPLSDGDVLELSRELCESFGADKFYLQRESSTWRANHHAIYENDADYLPFEYRVSLWTRYYGEGYERGDLPIVLVVAEWLENRVPGATVFYGGDSVEVQPFDRERRIELTRHFALHGHRPYRVGWNSIGDTIPRPFCDFCQIPFSRYGWGTSYGAYSCHGCGDDRQTRDGGKSWFREERKFRTEEVAVEEAS